MDKFIARENIRHFRDRLRAEPDGAKRALLNKLLIEEEDRLGVSTELIADVEREIATAKRLIKERRALIASLVRDGSDGAEQAQALLDGLTITLAIHEEYCAKLRRP